LLNGNITAIMSYKSFNKFPPAQGNKLQSTFNVLEPGHPSPSLHVRVRSNLPPPQVAEQSPCGCHALHSEVRESNKFIG